MTQDVLLMWMILVPLGVAIWVILAVVVFFICYSVWAVIRNG